MAITQDNDAKQRKKPLLLRVPTGVVLGTLFLVGLIYAFWYWHLVSGINMCAPKENLVGPYIPSFTSCLEINEIGDALGGAFGPLAFLFLAGALLIQSMELAAQRWELDETQEVMRQQVEVAKQQVDETKASTELFRRQTDILLREHELREMQQADREFDEMILSLKDYVQRCGGVSLTFDEWGDSPAKRLGLEDNVRYNYGHTLIICPEDTRAYDMETLAAEIIKRSASAFQTLSAEAVTIPTGSWDGNISRIIQSEISALLDKMPRLSPPHRIVAQRYQLQKIADQFQKIDLLVTLGGGTLDTD